MDLTEPEVDLYIDPENSWVYLPLSLYNFSQKQAKVSFYNHCYEGGEILDETLESKEIVDTIFSGSCRIIINQKIIIEIVPINTYSPQPELNYQIRVVSDPDQELIFRYSEIYEERGLVPPQNGALEFELRPPGEGDLLHI